MNTNPYEPPKAPAALTAMPNEERQTANLGVRIALVILLIPAIYNFICFNFPFSGNRVGFPVHGVFLTVNAIGLVLTAAGIWFFGLKLLEVLTGGIHFIVARKSKIDDWNEALYAIARRMPYFAVPGAVLWAIWVFGFYQLHLGFYIVSIPIGIMSHVLAAFLYVPLIYRWYKMERTTTGQVIT